MKKLIISLIVLVIVILGALGFFAYQGYRIELATQQSQIHNQNENEGEQIENKTPSNGEVVSQENSDNKEVCANISWLTPDSYEYRGKTLSYGCFKPNKKSPGYYTNLYITKETVRTDIGRYDVWVPERDNTKFGKTSLPNTVLLTSKAGDLGWYMATYYYINIETEKIFAVTFSNSSPNNDDEIFVNGNSIYLAIDDTCKNKGFATLKDIIVNGTLQNIAEPQQLMCSTDHVFGPDYIVSLKYEGVSKDLSKIFFSTFVNQSTTDYSIGSTHYYSFDLNKKNITEESPSDKL